MNSTKKQARLAGLLYLLASIIGPFCFIYVPGKLIVPGDATTTANHIRASETLLRLGIASELTSLWFWLYIAYSRRLTGNMRWRWRFCSCSPILSRFLCALPFRHHWKFSIKRAKAVKFGGKMVARAEEIPRAIPVNENEVNDARDWIRRAEPNLEEIEQRADAERQ